MSLRIAHNSSGLKSHRRRRKSVSTAIKRADSANAATDNLASIIAPYASKCRDRVYGDYRRREKSPRGQKAERTGAWNLTSTAVTAFFLLCKSRTRSSRAGKIAVGQKTYLYAPTHRVNANPLNPNEAGLDDDAQYSIRDPIDYAIQCGYSTPKLNGNYFDRICIKRII